MIAIRIEHPRSGKGLFTHYESTELGYKEGANYLSDSNNFYKRHLNFPNPKDDKKIKRFIAKNEFCAFKSVEQLKEWVTTEEIKEFIEMGFKVLLLDLTVCIEGDFQILFKKEDISQSKDITELFI